MWGIQNTRNFQFYEEKQGTKQTTRKQLPSTTNHIPRKERTISHNLAKQHEHKKSNHLHRARSKYKSDFLHYKKPQTTTRQMIQYQRRGRSHRKV